MSQLQTTAPHTGAPHMAETDTLSWLAGKKVVVSGGTGFVGRHLLPRLLATGAQVTCMTRASSHTSHLPADVRRAEVDLRTGQGLVDALRGKDVLIHMAALLFGLGWQDYLRANAAAAHALAAARQTLLTGGESCPARLVLISSLAAAGPCGEAPGRRENDLPTPVSAYGWSKLLVEQLLGRVWGDGMVVLRPPIIYGSGDKGLLPVFKGAARGFAVSPGAFRQFPVSAVHASDVAQAILLACQPKASGIYHLDDGMAHTMDSFCQVMGRALGRRSITMLHLPLPLLTVTAGASSLGGWLWDRALRLCRRPGLRRAPNWNLDKCREAREAGWLCHAGRIREELGYRPAMSLEDGMTEAVAGYRRDGWLPSPHQALPEK